jgi:hypothetical protein
VFYGDQDTVEHIQLTSGANVVGGEFFDFDYETAIAHFHSAGPEEREDGGCFYPSLGLSLIEGPNGSLAGIGLSAFLM